MVWVGGRDITIKERTTNRADMTILKPSPNESASNSMFQILRTLTNDLTNAHALKQSRRGRASPIVRLKGKVSLVMRYKQRAKQTSEVKTFLFAILLDGLSRFMLKNSSFTLHLNHSL